MLKRCCNLGVGVGDDLANLRDWIACMASVDNLFDLDKGFLVPPLSLQVIIEE